MRPLTSVVLLVLGLGLVGLALWPLAPEPSSGVQPTPDVKPEPVAPVKPAPPVPKPKRPC